MGCWRPQAACLQNPASTPMADRRRPDMSNTGLRGRNHLRVPETKPGSIHMSGWCLPIRFKFPQE